MSDQTTSDQTGRTGDATRDSGPDRIGKLERLVGPEKYQHLLATFVDHLSVQVAELRNATAVGDIPAARYVAHQIKGSAATFGAAHLDELADQLLGIGRDQAALLRPLVDQIDKAVGQLLSAAGHRERLTGTTGT